MHMYKEQENATFCGHHHGQQCWKRAGDGKGGPQPLVPPEDLQVGSPEKHDAMVQLGLHLAMVTAYTSA